jgi:hypothetical protein
VLSLLKDSTHIYTLLVQPVHTQTRLCCPVFGAHDVSEKRCERGRRRIREGGGTEMDVRVYVYENRDEILVYTAELFMMPDRDAMPKRSPRSRIPVFRHQHSSLPSCVLFHSFPPFTLDFLIFSFRSLILFSCLLSRQLSCFYLIGSSLSLDDERQYIAQYCIVILFHGCTNKNGNAKFYLLLTAIMHVELMYFSS